MMLSRSFVFARNFSKLQIPKLNDINLQEVKPKVFNVELNKEKQRNAFTVDLWLELKSCIKYLSQHSACRSIVISGAGKSFTAGIDIKEEFPRIISITNDESIDIARKGRALMTIIEEIQECFNVLERCPKPIISSIHSHCIGAGIDMICATDIRYASQDSVFSIKEIDIGMAADVGTLNRIQKVVGNDSWTREIALTGRNFTADEALKFGLISRIFNSKNDCFDACVELGSLIAEKSPIAVEGTKITLNHARNHSISDSLEFIKIWNASQLLTEDTMIAGKSAMNRKKPEFSDI
uniref:Delta(3,5)-Delta(2,4)-dienoyl-CoA isomerase, mitochondrial n=1 Tax=Parastrongyloides trichosuri TaxID=131310 RepID=A0A0N4ZXS2_PARTI